jgi:hypothetical protein
LTSFLEIIEVHINRGLLIELTKRWHSDTNTFHVATREIIVNPEDIYCILRILVMGTIIIHETKEVGGIDALRWIFRDNDIARYEIPWANMVDSYAPLPSMLVGFIGGVLCPDHKLKGFAVRWGCVLESMVMHGM